MRPRPLGQKVVQDDGVREEQHCNNHGQPCQIALNDVCSTLGARCKPHPAESGVTTRVHQDETDKGGRQQHVDDREEREHAGSVAQHDRLPRGPPRDTRGLWASGRGTRAILTRSRAYATEMSEEGPEAQIRRALLTGDNRLKQGIASAKVRESYQHALELAIAAGLEGPIRPLVEVRLADLQRRDAERPPRAEPEV